MKYISDTLIWTRFGYLTKTQLQNRKFCPLIEELEEEKMVQVNALRQVGKKGRISLRKKRGREENNK